MLTRNSIDSDAVRRGITVAGAISVTLSIISGVVVGSDPTSEHRGFQALSTLVVLAALTGGAYIAARRQVSGTPLMHGIVTTVAVTVVLTVVRVVWRALDDDRAAVAFTSVVSNLLLALICGIVGGVAGGRRRRSRATDL